MFFKKAQCIRQTLNKLFLNQMQQTVRKHWRAFRKISWSISEIIFTLVFFVVSREKRITKQMYLVLCGYFFWKKSLFLNIWGWRRSLRSPARLPTAHSIQSNHTWSDWKQTTSNMLPS